MYVSRLIELGPYQQEINANYPKGNLKNRTWETAENIISACPVTSHIYFDACVQGGILKFSLPA